MHSSVHHSLSKMRKNTYLYQFLIFVVINIIGALGDLLPKNEDVTSRNLNLGFDTNNAYAVSEETISSVDLNTSESYLLHEETPLLKRSAGIQKTTRGNTIQDTKNKATLGRELTSFSKEPKEPNQVCQTPECKSVASYMLSLMNHSVDPCENFYEFSCGASDPSYFDSDTLSLFSRQLMQINKQSEIFLQRFKQFYDTCLSYEDTFSYEKRIESVKSILNMTGHIDMDGNLIDRNITKLFANLILYGSMPLVDVGIDLDEDTSEYILQLTLPERSLVSDESERWSAFSDTQRRCLRKQLHKLYEPEVNLTNMYNSYLTCNENYESYLNSIENTIRALGFYSHMDAYNASQKIKGIRFSVEDDILGLIQRGPSIAETRKGIVNKEYIVQSVADLQRQCAFLNWTELFQLLVGHEVPDHTRVQVYFKDHFNLIFNKLSYMTDWKINALLAIFANDLFRNLVIPNGARRREELCLDTSLSLFHDVSSNLYMKSLSNSDITQKEEIIGDVFDQVIESFVSSYFESPTERVENLQVYFPKKEDNCISNDFLNMKYNSLHLKDDYPCNLVNIKMERKLNFYALEGQQFKEEVTFCQFIHPYDKKPFSFYANRLIAVPFGILSALQKNLPDYLVMARIGIHLGKEIGLHFDPVAIRKTEDLTGSFQKNYIAYKDTMKNAFLSAIAQQNELQKFTYQIDQELSLNSRIADNVGLKVITDLCNRVIGKSALLPWISTTYSTEKLFFIAIGQEFCQRQSTLDYMLQLHESQVLPAPLRLNSIVTSVKSFSKIFKCSERKDNHGAEVEFPQLPIFEYEEEFNFDIFE